MKKLLPLLGLIFGAASPAVAAPDEVTTPYVTPQLDVDVTYDASGSDGQIYRQRMRWNAAHWQQRLDMETTGLIMLTDYRAHRLSVVDVHAKTFTVSGAPDAQFAPPGQRAVGQWVKGAQDRVANQPCTHWTTVDTDGQTGDFCYSDAGVLLSASRGAIPVIKAIAYSETPQGPEVFKEPAGFHEIAAMKLAH
ncbi:hypothetical protein [Asaia astilbis]|uniref:hypothetical protein n=1 Tax=Asaia astilbis TaxID=610244 RepID=UPI00046F5CBE|nr:hypothetical protein [Asaia astilbis]